VKALITGSSGFVGQHLTELLSSEGIETIGFDKVNGQDITKPEMFEIINKERPNYIYHLAAMTSVPESFNNPIDCMATNIAGSINLLEAVRQADLTCNILLASSTEVYSPALDDTPLDVSSAIQPRTPYGVSKLAMEQLGAIYASVYKMHIVVTRTNNHTGPGQDGPFAVTSFARQIAEIERGERDVLKHGDLSSFKSYLDVRDVVKAYRIAIDLEPFVYNIASDEPVEMQSILNRLVAQANTPIVTSSDTSLMRPIAPDKTKYLTSSKLKQAGWKPEFNLERTLYDTLEYWRNK
jgi:GDP-4-dehydro-6-deoxy-D-mannose reductase